MVYKVGMERDVGEDEMTIYTRRLLRSASKKNVRKQVQRVIKIRGKKGPGSTVQQTTTLQAFFVGKEKKKKLQSKRRKWLVLQGGDSFKQHSERAVYGSDINCLSTFVSMVVFLKVACHLPMSF